MRLVFIVTMKILRSKPLPKAFFVFIICLKGYEAKFTGNNIALGKPTQQGPYDYCEISLNPWRICKPWVNDACPGCFGSDLAVDGDTNRYFRHGSCAHTNSPTTSMRLSWSVNLEGPYYLLGINVYNRVDCCQNNLIGFVVHGEPDHVEIYDDGKQASSRYTEAVIDIAIPEEYRHTKFSNITISFPAGNQHSYFVLCEVEVFSAPNCSIPVLENGNVTLSPDDIAEAGIVLGGTTIELRCNRGYSLNVLSTHTCGDSGTWTFTAEPTCAEIMCPIYNASSTNKYVLSNQADKYTIDMNLTAECIIGYKLSSGNLIRTCQENGEWSGQEPTCTIVTCPEVTQTVGHGQQWLPSKREFGAMINSSCDTGYKHTSGNQRRECQANGSWSGTHPICSIVTCPELTLTVDHGQQWLPHTSEFGSVTNSSCDTGYKHTSGNQRRECQANGTWSGTRPICSIVTCPEITLTLDHGQQWLPHASEFGSVTNSSCDTGYKHTSGNQKRECQANGTWSGTHPICSIVTCAHPNAVQGGQYYRELNNGSEVAVQNINKFEYNTILRFKCNSDFEISGTYSLINRTCQEDEHWSGEEPNCIELFVGPPDATTSNEGMVIGVVVAAAVLVIIIIVVVVILLRRWKQQKGDTAPNNETPKDDGNTIYSELDDIGESVEHPYSKNERVYTNNDIKVDISETNIEDKERIHEIQNKTEIEPEDRADEYYNIMSADKKSSTVIMLEDLTDFLLDRKLATQRLEEQLKKIPAGLIRCHKISRKHENLKKNRYNEIYAYDENRVVLRDIKDKEDTDYINASYIDGFDRPKNYIASQGPTKEMINDFWRMIWQVDSGKIVMLANLTEDDKTKCLQYWPHEGTCEFGRITVEVTDEEFYSDFVLRTFQVTNGSSEAKVIRQFHFTAWPDRGIPKCASSMLYFIDKVRNVRTNRNGPTIVHCSAGIGQTGTFIALNILIDQGKHLGYVDVATCVENLRKQRVNMVQNLEQFHFCHEVINAYYNPQVSKHYNSS